MAIGGRAHCLGPLLLCPPVMSCGALCFLSSRISSSCLDTSIPQFHHDLYPISFPFLENDHLQHPTPNLIIIEAENVAKMALLPAGSVRCSGRRVVRVLGTRRLGVPKVTPSRSCCPQGEIPTVEAAAYRVATILSGQR